MTERRYQMVFPEDEFHNLETYAINRQVTISHVIRTFCRVGLALADLTDSHGCVDVVDSSGKKHLFVITMEKLL